MSAAPQLITFRGSAPSVDKSAWIAPSATVLGAAAIAARVGVFYGAVVRADTSTISIGEGSNLQDGVVVHADAGFPATVGSGVSVGHRAVLHGCTVQDDCLIGMGAVVLNGAVIGAGSMVAAGAVVLEGAQIPPGSLVAGVPGKVRRQLTEEELAGIITNARRYVALTRDHATELLHQSG